MSEKYPTCEHCGSRRLRIMFEVNGDRTYLYGDGPGRIIEAEDVTDGGECSGSCLSCRRELEPDEIIWKEPAS